MQSKESPGFKKKSSTIFFQKFKHKFFVSLFLPAVTAEAESVFKQQKKFKLMALTQLM